MIDLPDTGSCTAPPIPSVQRCSAPAAQPRAPGSGALHQLWCTKMATWKETQKSVTFHMANWKFEIRFISPVWPHLMDADQRLCAFRLPLRSSSSSSLNRSAQQRRHCWSCSAQRHLVHNSERSCANNILPCKAKVTYDTSVNQFTFELWIKAWHSFQKIQLGISGE